MSNRLKDQRSPYLLQHAENPVEWFPWGEEAFRKAEAEDKPIFLSIGYSTCHWCHVMAHESFEDRETADILNKYFVSIKVDREERPDIDSVYMSVCLELTGSGGWPMSIFMTGEQKPFYAGTYFPPESRSGMIAFRELLLAIAQQWKENKAGLLDSAEHILSQISQPDSETGSGINRDLPHRAAELFKASFDAKYGGFGVAPKFPTPHNLLFLMLYARTVADREGAAHALSQVKKTLEQMRLGGIFDHIGFGFARYSTDPFYLVPHFEKMLYDNALLILAYAVAYKVSSDQIFLDTAEKTADYILREMTAEEGGFYSAQDADSKGGEGIYYLWEYEEVCHVLGREKGAEFCHHFGITERGNFEGKNIPNLLGGGEISDQHERERKLLYEYRRARVPLHLDDKILTSWNSLMICAMAVLYQVSGKQEYLLAATRAQQFIEKYLVEGDILYVSHRGGACSVKGFLDEYAFYTAALINLYEVTTETDYLDRAQQICRQAIRQFAGKERNGYYLYGAENGDLIMRPKETYDGALPSGNSVIAYCLVRLSQIIDGKDAAELAKQQLAFLSAEAENYPAGHSMFLIALLMHDHPPEKITVVLAERECPEEILPCLPLYAEVKIFSQPTEQYSLLNNRTTYYVCRDHICLPPTNYFSELLDFTTL